MTTLDPLHLKWQQCADVDRAIRLYSVLESWWGTPYMAGQACKGEGVFCIGFIAAVLDEMSGQSRDYSRLPADTSLHDPEGALATVAMFRQTFQPNLQVTGAVEPGDIVVVGAHSGGPGHGMIVGPEEKTLWHASPRGVRKTGFLLDRLYSRVFDVFRWTGEVAWPQ